MIKIFKLNWKIIYDVESEIKKKEIEIEGSRYTLVSMIRRTQVNSKIHILEVVHIDWELFYLDDVRVNNDTWEILSFKEILQKEELI